MEDVPWMAWMAWTPATAAFFVAVGLLLAVMIWLARTRPEVERVGVLGIPTTRGDRLFLVENRPQPPGACLHRLPSAFRT